jgi:large subunit ribosomal protein L23
MKLTSYQDVVLAPVISEKAYNQHPHKKFTFKVHPKATKVQIREAIEHMFPGVKVGQVNTVHVRGKFKNRGRTVGKLPDWKKAVVTVKEGEIDLFEQV